LTSILDRTLSIKGEQRIPLPFTPHYKEGGSEIAFKDLTRYSSRQNTKMQLGGIVGYIKYDVIDEKSYMLLKLGEIIALGKQTVFGLGEIKVCDRTSA
jgi:hypothetical protein